MFSLCFPLSFVVSGLTSRGFSSGSVVENLTANAEVTGDTGLILGQEDPLEEEMVTHFRSFTGIIPRTEDPGRLQSMASQRVRYD